jgi:hypothetical protein
MISSFFMSSYFGATCFSFFYCFFLSLLIRACAEAAYRVERAATPTPTTTTSATTSATTEEVRQKDLLAAGEAEIAKLKSGNFELMSKLFT